MQTHSLTAFALTAENVSRHLTARDRSSFVAGYDSHSANLEYHGAGSRSKNLRDLELDLKI